MMGRALFVLVCSTMLFAQSASAKKCRKGQREVKSGTAVLGGPALGFETIKVIDRTDCFKVLRTTEDGAFALILLGKERVGWVSQGLVDARLSEDKNAKPVDEQDSQRFVSKDIALRKTPRFDGKATSIIKAGSEVTATGRSPDGLWRYVEAGSKKGWVPRYALTEKAIEPTDKPSAGDGPWSVREVDKTPAVPDEETPEPVEPPKPPLVVTRGQAAWFDVIPLARWEQRYNSNAQSDPLAKYNVRSIGGGLGGGYAFRSDAIPFVFETAADFNVWRFNALAPGAAAPQGINTIYVDVLARAAIPLVRNNDVDIEAGIGGGATTFVIDQLNDALGQPTKTFSSTLYLDALPYVAVRARVGGGHLGEISATAAVGVGLLFLLDDPANVQLTPEQLAALNPGAEVIDQPVDPEAPPEAPPQASDNSLALGVDLRVRYRYPLSERMSLDFGAMLKARQSAFEGPGIRFLNVYTAASNVDFVLGATTGLTFQF